jgi:hypothetical protein
MSKVVIQGHASGTGDFTIAAPNSNTDRTLTLPDVAGTVLTSGSNADFPAGSVLQVVQTVKTDTFSTTALTSSPADVTNMSVAITPTNTSSKILVLVNGVGGYQAYQVNFRLMRNSTPISIGDAIGSRPRTSVTSGSYVGNASYEQYHYSPFSICYLDSPSTTSSTTYKLQMGTYNASYTVYLNRNHGYQNTANYDATTASSITVMEIAG